MWAAGAEEVVQEPRYAHLVGAARMGHDPRTSVVDRFGRTHDIPNLFVCDGSIFPTQGSANPGLTIQALAARTADYLIAEGDAVTTDPNASPSCRRFATISRRTVSLGVGCHGSNRARTALKSASAAWPSANDD